MVPRAQTNQGPDHKGLSLKVERSLQHQGVLGISKSTVNCKWSFTAEANRPSSGTDVEETQVIELMFLKDLLINLHRRH